MNNEEKILAILEKHSEMFEQITSSMTQMREEQNQMRKEQNQMREEQNQMRDDITAIKIRLDYDIDKRFDAINEGIDAILEQLTPRRRVDDLEADVVVLKTAVKMLTQEVAELKKAQ